MDCTLLLSVVEAFYNLLQLLNQSSSGCLFVSKLIMYFHVDNAFFKLEEQFVSQFSGLKYLQRDKLN